MRFQSVIYAVYVIDEKETSQNILGILSLFLVF